jgi:hypothetical protein
MSKGEQFEQITSYVSLREGDIKGPNQKRSATRFRKSLVAHLPKWKPRSGREFALLVSRLPQRMMMHCIAVVFTVGMVGTSALSQPQSRTVVRERMQMTPPGIVGVWKVIELLSRAPGENWTNVSPQQSLYIFTKKHYSYMYNLGKGPRPLFAGDPNKPTDAEMVTAYRTFVAATGT